MNPARIIEMHGRIEMHGDIARFVALFKVALPASKMLTMLPQPPLNQKGDGKGRHGLL